LNKQQNRSTPYLQLPMHAPRQTQHILLLPRLLLWALLLWAPLLLLLLPHREIFGVDVGGNGVLAGVTASLQFQYTESDARMESSTDQNTMVASVDVTLDPEDGECVWLTTFLDKVKADGKIAIYAVFDHWIGIYQKERT
jgi:hypothetical protein